MKIILGSTSKYRQKILADDGLEFSILDPDIDEKSIRCENIYELPSVLADAKLEAILEKYTPDGYVVTADQVTVCDGLLYEKPENLDEVRRRFEKYGNGYPAEIVSSITVFNTKNDKKLVGTDIVKIYFKKVPSGILEEYIKQGNPLVTSGGFETESPIINPFIERREGTKDSAIGMPLSLLKELLDKVK